MILTGLSVTFALREKLKSYADFPSPPQKVQPLLRNQIIEYYSRSWILFISKTLQGKMKMPPLFISFTACRRCQNISLLLFFQLRTPKRLRAAFLLGLSPAMSLTMFFLDACTWRRKKQLKCINSATTCGYNFFSEHEILLKLIFYSFMITDSNLTVWFNRGNICYQIQW